MKTLIFDMDGVITRSPEFYWEARRLYLAELGVKLELEVIQKLLGKPLILQVGELNKIYSLNLNYEEFQKKTHTIAENLMHDKNITVKGIVEFIKKNKKNKLAIFSNNIKRNVFPRLKNLAIQDYFKVILTYEDMTHSKDSKESFFQILNLLESKPEDCTYFDDTNEGLKIAKELGMKTIGVSNKFIQKFSSADKVIESFTDVEEE